MRLLICLFSICLTAQVSAQTDFSDKFVPKWDRAIEYTIEVLEAMPEEYYNFKPVEEVRTFQEQAVHLVQNFKGLQKFITGNKECVLDSLNLEELSKKEMITTLTEAGDFIKTLALSQTKKNLKKPVDDFFREEISIKKEGVFWLMKDHLAHHRGQMIVYLRINGIKPPRYRGW